MMTIAFSSKFLHRTIFILTKVEGGGGGGEAEQPPPRPPCLHVCMLKLVILKPSYVFLDIISIFLLCCIQYPIRGGIQC